MSAHQTNQEHPASTREKHSSATGVPPEYGADVIPSRSALMARAFDLGVEHVEVMSDQELVAAITRQEEALARSLQ